jgi:DNA-directed RNA polymerase subunit F
MRVSQAFPIPDTLCFSLEQLHHLSRCTVSPDHHSDSPSGIRTVFRLRKTPEEVSMINIRSGKSQRVEQDLIHLDVDMDITMLAVQFNSQRVISTGVDAVKLLNGGSHKSALPDEESGSDKEGESNNDFFGPNPACSSTDKKELSKKAKKLFDILAKQFSSNDSIKAKLLDLTGKESFFDLSDEEAEAAISEIVGNKSNNGDNPEKTLNSELPEEVKELKNILTAMYEKNGSDAVTKKLKELTGLDSFEKLSKEKANEAIEALTAASMSEF